MMLFKRIKLWFGQWLAYRRVRKQLKKFPKGWHQDILDTTEIYRLFPDKETPLDKICKEQYVSQIDVYPPTLRFYKEYFEGDKRCK